MRANEISSNFLIRRLIACARSWKLKCSYCQGASPPVGVIIGMFALPFLHSLLAFPMIIMSMPYLLLYVHHPFPFSNPPLSVSSIHFFLLFFRKFNFFAKTILSHFMLLSTNPFASRCSPLICAWNIRLFFFFF